MEFKEKVLKNKQTESQNSTQTDEGLFILDCLFCQPYACAHTFLYPSCGLFTLLPLSCYRPPYSSSKAYNCHISHTTSYSCFFYLYLFFSSDHTLIYLVVTALLTSLITLIMISYRSMGAHSIVEDLKNIRRIWNQLLTPSKLSFTY